MSIRQTEQARPFDRLEQPFGHPWGATRWDVPHDGAERMAQVRERLVA